MKIVAVKRIRDLCENNPHARIPQTAEDGIRVLVDGQNIIGDDADHFASFRNSDYESTDGYAVMSLLRALEERGVIKLECDDDVRAHYFNEKRGIAF